MCQPRPFPQPSPTELQFGVFPPPVILKQKPVRSKYHDFTEP
jgi:CO dehydrogenase/acetyl-CoA synthase delta subunit